MIQKRKLHEVQRASKAKQKPPKKECKQEKWWANSQTYETKHTQTHTNTGQAGETQLMMVMQENKGNTGDLQVK